MKKIVSFLAIFFVFFIGSYVQAAVFPHYPKVTKQQVTAVKQVNVLPYTKIEANDYANLIGQSTATLVEQFGKPQTITPISGKRFLYDFGADYDTFLKVYVEDNRVVEIFSLGDKLKQEPFKLGMSMKDLTQITPLQATFRFDYLEEAVSFELTEKELDACPLVAFDNDTFAIFYFDEVNKKLLAINYLSQETLLEEMPYQLNEGQIPLIDRTAAPDKKVANQLKTDLYRQTLDVLRQKNDLPTLSNLHANNANLLQVTQNLEQNFSKYFTDQEIHDFKASQVIGQLQFQLGSKRATEILQKVGVQDVDEAMMRVPKIDPLGSAVTDFTTGSLAKSFHDEENKILSVAFDDNLMVVLITTNKIDTQTSSQEGTK